MSIYLILCKVLRLFDVEIKYDFFVILKLNEINKKIK